MVINTRLVRQFSKVLEFVHSKDDSFKESVYLDFKDESIYFNNNGVFGRLKLEYENDGASVDNFYVSIQHFLALCEQYDELNVNDSAEFSNGKEKFLIPSLLLLH